MLSSAPRHRRSATTRSVTQHSALFPQHSNLCGADRKPNSVLFAFARSGDHSSATRVAAVVEQPTRKLSTETGGSSCFPIWSCSAGGLPCRRRSRVPRCALTAPFHPCLLPSACAFGRSAVCSLLHFPSRRRAWMLSSLLPVGVRTFLRFRGDPPSHSTRRS